MTREQVYERLNQVFREVFDDDSIEVNDSTVANDIPEWDSFEHVNLIVSVEDEFNLGFAVSMKNLVYFVDLILQMGQ